MANFYLRAAFYGGVTLLILGCSAQTKHYDVVAKDGARMSLGTIRSEVSTMKSAPAPAKKPGKKTTWKPSDLRTNKVRLKVGSNEELPLKSVRANVQIDGFRARVVLDYHFYNKFERQLEGTFQLRMPNGASPYYLAFGKTRYVYQQAGNQASQHIQNFNQQQYHELSIDALRQSNRKEISHIKEAYVVPQQKAARAYHTTVRRQIDPALLEWTGAGVFNGRVYPLEAKSLHRIIIGYDVDLLQTDQGLQLDFLLPAQTDERAVHFNIAKLRNYSVTLNNRPLAGRAGHRIKISRINSAQKLFRLQLKRQTARTGKAIALTENTHSANQHFAARFLPRLPVETASNRKPDAVFLLDTSLSRKGMSFNRSVQLIQRVLANNRSIKRFALLTFNARMHWWNKHYIKNTPNNRSRLKDYLNNLVLEGATDLDAVLHEATLPKLANIDTGNANLFLLSDGAITWGESNSLQIMRRLRQRLAGRKLFAYSTGQAGVNTHLLTQLTSATGGAYYSVNSDDQLRKASTAFNYRAWRLAAIRVPGTNDLLVKGRPAHVYPNQYITVTGRGSLTTGSPIQLILRNGKRRRQVTVRVAALVKSALAKRTFGQIAVEQMESLQQHRFDQLARAYAIQYRVVGKNATLLMLDSTGDYTRFNIKTRSQQAATLVEQTRAAKIIRTLASAEQTRRASARNLFITRLYQLEHTPGVKLQLDKSLLSVIQSLPDPAFEVAFDQARVNNTAPLTKSSVNRSYLARLNKQRGSMRPFVQEYQRRLRRKQPDSAIVALSNLVELNPGHSKTLRAVSYYLVQANFHRDAYYITQKMIDRKVYEPQSYLALARIAKRINKPELAFIYYSIILHGNWDGRHYIFKDIAALERQTLMRTFARARPAHPLVTYYTNQIRQHKPDTALPDFMVTLEWNTDGNLMELRTVQPEGQKTQYLYTSLPKTNAVKPEHSIISNSGNRGYGPISFATYKPAHGHYAVGLKYRQNDSNHKSLQTQVLVTVYRHLGKSNESIQHKVITLTRLKGRKWFWNEFIGEQN